MSAAAASVHKITKNSFYLAIANISNKLILSILFMIMVRYLGDVFFGKYSFAITLVTLFAIISDLGMGTLISREITRDKESLSKYFVNVTAIKLATSLLAYALIIIAINFLDYPADTKFAVYILGLYALANTAIISFIDPIFRAFENMEYEALVGIVQNILTLALGALVMYLNLGFMVLMTVFVVGSLVGLATGVFIVFKKYTIRRAALNLRFSLQFMGSLSAFAMNAILVTLYANIDKILLSMLRGDAVVGLYSSVKTLVNVMLILSGAYNGAIFPAMVKAYVSNMDTLKYLYEKSFKYLFMISLPIAVGTTLLANGIVALLLGNDFTGAAAMLQILVWMLIFMYLNNMTGNMFCSINKQIVGSTLAGVLVVINITLNLLLIPFLGGIGTAVAAVVTEGLGFLYSLYYMSRHLHKIQLKETIFKPVAASAVMGAFVYAANLLWPNVLVSVFIGMLVYTASIIVIGGLSSDDLYLLGQVVGTERIKRAPAGKSMIGMIRYFTR
jgi:O-antigen/teichoic acid export membrane protein